MRDSTDLEAFGSTLFNLVLPVISLSLLSSKAKLTRFLCLQLLLVVATGLALHHWRGMGTKAWREAFVTSVLVYMVVIQVRYRCSALLFVVAARS